MPININTELIVGTLVAIGGAVAVLNRLGMLKFSKKNGDGKCPDPGCKEDLGHRIDKVDRILRDDVFPKLNKVAENVAFIKGRIESLHNRGN